MARINESTFATLLGLALSPDLICVPGVAITRTRIAGPIKGTALLKVPSSVPAGAGGGLDIEGLQTLGAAVSRRDKQARNCARVLQRNAPLGRVGRSAPDRSL